MWSLAVDFLFKKNPDMQFWVYMLLCSDQSFYVGVTSSLDRRIAEHASGLSAQSYTFRRRPVCLVYTCDFPEVGQAIAWEKAIKRWSRAKKQALVDGNYMKLRHLAICQNMTHHSYASLDSARDDVLRQCMHVISGPYQ